MVIHYAQQTSLGSNSSSIVEAVTVFVVTELSFSIGLRLKTMLEELCFISP
jgi:hypothetical protein